jgi:hypothetical protein
MKSLGMKCDAPCCPSSLGERTPGESYPSLYIETEEELELPEAGEARIKFVRTKVTEETRPGKPEKYCYCLDVVAIGDVKEVSGPNREDSEDVLDKLMREVTESEEGEY